MRSSPHRTAPGIRRLVFALIVAVLAAGLVSACDSDVTSHVPASQGTAAAHRRLPANALPRPAHIVIVVEENKAHDQIVGNDRAALLNRMAATGATLQRFYGITHPSEPNYLALFSGSTHGLSDDSCPHHYTSANLASALEHAGYSFATYSQGLPDTGFDGCHHGQYARKHNPAVNWQGANVTPEQNRPFRDFPRDFNKLPTVSLVIPDLDHDMHSASIQAGDTWLGDNLGRYARWARHHDSLLIVTWDEDNKSANNHIPTILTGDMVKPGTYDDPFNLYNLLRTIEAMYGLPLLGKSAQAVPITAVWRRAD